jgi:hypothetical protein
MTTKVIFNIDKKLKEKAMQKAQSEGIALTSVLKFATKAFVDGELSLGLKFNSKTRQIIQDSLDDIALKKNLSSRFKSAKEAARYLNS